MTRKSTWLSRGKPLPERFWEKVERGPSCWIWTSAFGARGYGVFYLNAKERSRSAHRVSYELTKGQIPKGLCVMHSCDNKKCVNPEHLSLGTPAENARDAGLRGLMPRGTANKGGGKLTETQVREIRGAAEGCLRLSRRFNVSAQTIKAIRRGRIWRHVQ